MTAPLRTTTVVDPPAVRPAPERSTSSRSLSRTLGMHAVRYGTTGLALAAASIAASASSAAADETYEVERVTP